MSEPVAHTTPEVPPRGPLSLGGLGGDEEQRPESMLDLEPDWLEEVAEPERRLARAMFAARIVRLPLGRWKPELWQDVDAYGLYVIDGLLVRRLEVGRVSSVELLGPGDILRPAYTPLAESMLPPTVTWKVISAARVAVMDGRITRAAGRWPRIALALSDRLLRRARHAAHLMATGHFVLVEDRLLGAFWHMAFVWGRVTPQGIVIPFRLTHEMLAEIVGAQRPTVTVAIRELRQRGKLLRRSDRCYVLPGSPPDWSTDATPTTTVDV